MVLLVLTQINLIDNNSIAMSKLIGIFKDLYVEDKKFGSSNYNLINLEFESIIHFADAFF